MFNINLLEKRKLKNKNKIKKSDFLNFLQDDLIERILVLDKNFNNILLVSEFTKIKNCLEKKYHSSEIICLENLSNLYIELENNIKKYDLIILPFLIHWVGDIKKFLQDIIKIMHDDAVIIGNFVGGGSLQNLRRNLVTLETEHTNKISNRISPFLQFDQLSLIFQEIGFKENIIDVEEIKLEFDSFLSFMKAIKNIGESSAFKQESNIYLNRNIYNKLAEKKGENDIVKIINFLSSKNKGSLKFKI